MTSIRNEPITDRSAWRGADLLEDRSFEHELTDAHLAELACAAAKVADQTVMDLDLDAFRTPALIELMSAVSDELQGGRGFSLLHGFPVTAYPLDQLEKLYWGLCGHLGTAVTQNGQAGLIHYVTDGQLRPSQGNRGVGEPRESRLHVDLTDCVSLLCVRQAPDDPASRVSSSMHLYNEILQHRPRTDLERLYAGFQWDRQGEHAAHETPTTGYRVPFFSQRDGVVSCQYNRGWILPAAKRLEMPLSEAEAELFEFVDAVNHRDCFEFPFHAGDIQFCNNYTTMHGRAAHAAVPVEERKRVLLRIWLDFPEARAFSNEALVRYGIVRHGALGWTVDDLHTGRHLQPRPRDAAGLSAI